jgi:hypothetical protein
LPYPFFRVELGAFFAVRLARFVLFLVVVFLWVVFFFAGACVVVALDDCAQTGVVVIPASIAAKANVISLFISIPLLEL